jgi:transcription initiation factor TFIIIB Brf1 subunit/transcription initiation factor TFIIB
MPEKCPNCGSKHLSEDSGLPGSEVKAVCKDCGRVFRSSEDLEIDGFEPKTEPEADSKSPKEPEWSGVSKVSDGTEANVARGLEILEEFSDRLSVSKSVRKLSAELYAEAMTEGSTTGRDLKTIVAVCLRAAMHQQGETYPDSRISEVSNVEQDSLSNLSKALHRELGLEKHIPKPTDHISYLSEELDIEEEVKEKARGILQNIDQKSVSGRSPVSYAAAALYIGSTGDLTQREVAIAAGITTETVRVRLRDLEEYRVPHQYSDGGD